MACSTFFNIKTKSNGRTQIFLFNHKLFSFKKRSLDEQQKRRAIKHLEKYKYILKNKSFQNNFINVSNANFQKYKNSIWILWFQGIENAPDIVKKCINNIRLYSNNRKIVILSEKNLFNYIDIPNFIMEKYKSGIISKTHLSDIIRLILLINYGGTWIDSTVLLTGFPSSILNSDFFVFKDTTWYKSTIESPSFTKNILSPNLIHNFFTQKQKKTKYPSISSWFIHTKNPNNYLLICVLNLLIEYWKKENSQIDYFIFHYFFVIAINNDKFCRHIFNSMVEISNRDVHLLQTFMLEKYQKDIFNEIISLTPIHKLTYKYNKDLNIEGAFIDKILTF